MYEYIRISDSCVVHLEMITHLFPPNGLVGSGFCVCVWGGGGGVWMQVPSPVYKFFLPKRNVKWHRGRGGNILQSHKYIRL